MQTDAITECDQSVTNCDQPVTIHYWTPDRQHHTLACCKCERVAQVVYEPPYPDGTWKRRHWWEEER